MDIKKNIDGFNNYLQNTNCRLVAVSKTKPVEDIREAYDAGQRIFGENKVQEMTEKQVLLPLDIEWHMIGHLQTNKVKYIAPFVSLIHSVDSLKLLKEVDKQAKKNDRVIKVLLQLYIAEEETKFGLDKNELFKLIHSLEITEFKNVEIVGFMGMATFTDNEDQIRKEFKFLKKMFDEVIRENLPSIFNLSEISMGMSGDYKIAIEEGSTLIRVGGLIFGERNYNK